MRKLVLLGVAALLATAIVQAPVQAGDVNSLIEMARSDIRADKVKILTAAMALNEAEAEKFWPLQRAHEADLAKINDKRLALIKDYGTSMASMTDQKADEIMKEAFKLQDERLSLMKKYYKQIAKEVSPTVAARFVQIENQIGDLIDLQVASELPLITKTASSAQQGE
jgi:hypothetical protein